MIKCVVVGKQEDVSEIRKKLESARIATNAIGNRLTNEQIVVFCAHSCPVVVVVFVRDFLLDSGTSLFAALREKLGNTVFLHAFVEPTVSKEEMTAICTKLKEVGVNKITFSCQLSPLDTARVIREYWFGGKSGGVTVQTVHFPNNASKNKK